MMIKNIISEMAMVHRMSRRGGLAPQFRRKMMEELGEDDQNRNGYFFRIFVVFALSVRIMPVQSRAEQCWNEGRFFPVPALH